MLDLKYIRENTGDVISALHYRQDNPTPIKILLMRDAELRRSIQSLEAAQATRNELSAQIGKLKRDKGDEAEITQLQIQAGMNNAVIELGTESVRSLEKTVRHLQSLIPNLPMKGIPLGPNEDFNVEIKKEGKKPTFLFPARQHFEIAGAGMDFETGAKVSGSRYVFLKGNIARLERALGQFMIDFHTKFNGYTEVSPPYIVNEEAMFGTGQLPKFAEDLYRSGDQFLIPTAEVSLTNMFRDSIVTEKELGRFCALTPCFRAEAGSAGKDTRGLIRQHQFHKVELVSVTTEEQADGEHEHMLACVEEMLKALELPYRVVLLCTGDMGFSARKTFDIEVWLPGQDAYREISSISYCGDFQGRRMNARYRPAGEMKGTKFVHTFNGSGVAVGRALVAVLENFQNDDGSITVPSALRPYMDQNEIITP